MTGEWPKVSEFDFDGFLIKHTDCGLQLVGDKPCYRSRFEVVAEINTWIMCDVPEEAARVDVQKVRAREAAACLEALIVEHRIAIGG